MTIDEAISHCLKVAAQQEISTDDRKMYLEMLGEYYKGFEEGCQQCAAEHRQLAEWLTDYKNLREENKVLTQKCDRLIQEKGELLKKSEQIGEYKRLLKGAVEDFAVYGALKDLSAEQRVQNPDWQKFIRVFDVLDHQWRYATEALNLLGGE